jgi:hypothetical protein
MGKEMTKWLGEVEHREGKKKEQTEGMERRSRPAFFA